MTHSFAELWLPWYSLTLWGIGIILIISITTRFWKVFIRPAYIFAIIGWICAFIGGSGIWFIGWFAWVVPLSATIAIRLMFEHAMNLPNNGIGSKG